MKRYTRPLLLCGILSSIYYGLLNVFVPFGFDGYSYVNQTVSELSAIGAPTRILWITLASAYVVMFGAFGLGVKTLALHIPRLRILGTIIIVYTVLNVYWPPMHLRGAIGSVTDTLHIVWAMIAVALMIAMMIIGMPLFGSTFRNYTIATLLINIVFGILTGREAAHMAANGPTPWIGVWERLNIGAFMLWIVVLAYNLLSVAREAFPGMRKESPPAHLPSIF